MCRAVIRGKKTKKARQNAFSWDIYLIISTCAVIFDQANRPQFCLLVSFGSHKVHLNKISTKQAQPVKCTSWATCPFPFRELASYTESVWFTFGQTAVLAEKAIKHGHFRYHPYPQSKESQVLNARVNLSMLSPLSFISHAELGEHNCCILSTALEW